MAVARVNIFTWFSGKFAWRKDCNELETAKNKVRCLRVVELICVVRGAVEFLCVGANWR